MISTACSTLLSVVLVLGPAPGVAAGNSVAPEDTAAAGDTPAAGEAAAAADTPAVDTLAVDTPAADTPGGDRPAAEGTPAGDTPPGGDTTAQADGGATADAAGPGGATAPTPSGGAAPGTPGPGDTAAGTGSVPSASPGTRARRQRPEGHGLVVGGVAMVVGSLAAYAAMAAGLGIGNTAENQLRPLHRASDIERRRDVIARGTMGNRLAIGAGISAAVLMSVGIALIVIGRRRAGASARLRAGPRGLVFVAPSARVR